MFTATSMGVTVAFDGHTVSAAHRFPDANWSVGISAISDLELRSPGIQGRGSLRFRENGQMKRRVEFEPAEAGAFDSLYRLIRDRLVQLPALQDQFQRALSPGAPIPATTPATPGTVTRKRLRLGEVNQHFDRQTASVMTGLVNHELGFHGSVVGLSVGGVGLGLGRIGLSGQSGVEMSGQSTARVDLLNDAFVAVFDEPSPGGVPDTLRVIVPSEAACREFLGTSVSAVGTDLGIPGWRLGPLTDVAVSAVSPEIGYVADRLGAALRAGPNPDLAFSVVGISVAPHTLLGGAIRMPKEDRWVQLFPVALLRFVGALSARLSLGDADSQAALTPPGG